MKSEKTILLFKDIVDYFDSLSKEKDKSISGMLGLFPLDYSYEEGTLELAFRVTPFMINSLNCLHGGIVSTVLDITMGDLGYAMTEHKSAPTAQMNINFLKPAFLGDFLISKAWCKKVGRSLIALYGEIHNPATGEIIANGTANFCIVPTLTEN